MNLKSTFILSAALLFLSAPAWGNNMKFKSHGASPNNINFHQSSSNSPVSDLQLLGGFKAGESNKPNGVFNFNEDRFVLIVPSTTVNLPGGSNDGPGSNPVSTPEPAALSLLLVGLVALGAFAYRQNAPLVGAH